MRMLLLALGILSLVLAFVLGAIGHRSGNALLMRVAVAYVILSVLFFCSREILNWLKQRRKRAVRKRRAAGSSQVESESVL